MAYKNSNPLIPSCSNSSGDTSSTMSLVVDNSSVLIVKGSETTLDISFKDMFIPVSEYGVQEFVLPPGATYAINSGLVSNPNGTLNSIVIKVTYPAADTSKATITESKKYIQMLTATSIMPIGKIMILTGTDESGWFMYGSPGNLTLRNPHINYAATVKVLYTSMIS
jgi:hypothetical protein